VAFPLCCFQVGEYLWREKLYKEKAFENHLFIFTSQEHRPSLSSPQQTIQYITIVFYHSPLITRSIANMKFITILTVATASIVSAQNLQGIPECAVSYPNPFSNPVHCPFTIRSRLTRFIGSMHPRCHCQIRLLSHRHSMPMRP
jgi:hypothetical protein